MNSSNEELLLNELKHIFSLVNGWLQFAEAKNGSIAALSSAAVIGILNSIKERPSIPLLWMILWFSASALTGLLSFFPNLTTFEASPHTEVPLKNAVFYAELAKLKDSQAYVGALAARMFGHTDEVCQTVLMNDYAEEIIQNSRIVVRKNRHFKIALWCTLIGVVGWLLLVVLSVFAR